MNLLRCLLVILLSVSTVSAEDRVWSAVVLATKKKKTEKTTEVPAELAPYVSKLVKVFGYDRFEILGSATKSMDDQSERWLVPSQNFWLGVHAKKEDDAYNLSIEFFHDKRRLVEATAKLGLNTPLVLRGPMHARGQLLVIFEIKN